MEIKSYSKLLIRLFKFFVPIIIGFGVIIIIGLLMEESQRLKLWSLVTLYFFPPAGKETVIPAGVAAHIHPLVIALTIAFVDIIVALFLVWNYDLTKKIPLVGRFITKIENIGKKSSSKYNWIKPLRFVGIILFVMVPFQGSGALVGSIIGRLIGMKPINTFLAITVGALVGCVMIAFFADAILSVFITNFLMGMLIIIILLVVAFMVLILKNNKKKNKSLKK